TQIEFMIMLRALNPEAPCYISQREIVRVIQTYYEKSKSNEDDSLPCPPLTKFVDPQLLVKSSRPEYLLLLCQSIWKKKMPKESFAEPIRGLIYKNLPIATKRRDEDLGYLHYMDKKVKDVV